MSRPRFLADHDLNEHIVSGVLRHEPLIGFLRVRDVGMASEPDAAILEFAHEQRLLIVSHDVTPCPRRLSSESIWASHFPVSLWCNRAYR